MSISSQTTGKDQRSRPLSGEGADLDDQTGDLILSFQKNEITEYHIYRRLAAVTRDEENCRILQRFSEDEGRHYEQWKALTNGSAAPDRIKILWYTFLGRLLGLTFALRLMERGEESAQVSYASLLDKVPQANAILQDENAHEEGLLEMLDEERLRYTGSIVLGLNDALVELTGALAGLTLALRDTNLIALTALITGIAASMSMAASEYLSTKSEETVKTPGRASLYTGIAYVLTVMVLVAPYLILNNYYVCLGVSLLIAVMIIAGFNYYVAVAKDQPFKRRFFEMAGLSLSIAALSFGVGYVIRTLFGVEV